MPSPIRNEWSIKKILQNTYHHMRNRYDYKTRDVIKRIIVKEVKQLKGSVKEPPRTKFVIISQSYPQYAPYYTPTDSRGRPRSYQRTYKHQYEVTIELDRLSINAPFKGRVGSDRKWRFDSRTRKDRNSGRVIESENIKLGINGDFWFRCSWVWQQNGILFGRNWAIGPPNVVNPHHIVFAPKHFISVCEQLINRGILKNV